ncbi:protein of unknown function [Streptomyces sp. KY75]|nr:protein of unknown function [Streptomyces sp. KY70]CAD5988676.1 protein of unknown function [Streptomyces sp. KY75]
MGADPGRELLRRVPPLHHPDGHPVHVARRPVRHAGPVRPEDAARDPARRDRRVRRGRVRRQPDHPGGPPGRAGVPDRERVRADPAVPRRQPGAARPPRPRAPGPAHRGGPAAHADPPVAVRLLGAPVDGVRGRRGRGVGLRADHGVVRRRGPRTHELRWRGRRGLRRRLRVRWLRLQLRGLGIKLRWQLGRLQLWREFGRLQLRQQLLSHYL